MPKICNNLKCSTTEVDEAENFCPECGSTLTVVVSSGKSKSKLQDDVYDYLNKKFEDVYAAEFDNVKSIDLFDHRDSSAKKVYANWVKRSSSLVLKDGNPFLSVEMMAKEPSPITVAGNILIHAIGDSVVVKFKDSREDQKYILKNQDTPRFLLIVIPEPPEDSDKKNQMNLIEQLVKELDFLDNSSLTNFRICFMSNFEEAVEGLVL